MLKRYQPIWINTHFNHPNELTAEAGAACQRIVDAGIPLGNQTVLLKGVNDELGTMKELMLRLVHNRVRPYYLYQCDLSRGISHFRTPVEKGVEIVQGLQGFISGFAVPKFVIDAPGGGGKVPICHASPLRGRGALSRSDRLRRRIRFLRCLPNALPAESLRVRRQAARTFFHIAFRRVTMDGRGVRLAFVLVECRRLYLELVGC